MDVFAGEKHACPCSKKGQSFQKLLELKNSGLVVYLHKTRADDTYTPSLIRQGGAVRDTLNPSEDVIIIQNKKNVKVTTSELMSEFEKKNISCPRCRKTFEHAEELMQGVKSIDRKIVMGICDHCRKHSQTTEKPFCDCDQIVKKFMYVKGEEKEDTKKYAKQLFPPEIGLFRKDVTIKKKKQTRTFSDTQINVNLSAPFKHDPDVQPLFYSHTDLKSDTTEMSETDLRELCKKKGVTFIQPTESHESKHTIIPDLSLLESNKQEQIFEDIPSLDAKEALKRRHDISLRQMMRLDKDTNGPQSDSERPVCESPIMSPWEQIADIKKISTPTKSKQDPSARDRDDPNKQLRFIPLRTSQKNLKDSYFEPSKFDPKHHDIYIKKDENIEIERSFDKISPKMKKTKQVSKSKSLETVGSVLKPDFSFSFPKIKEKKIIEIKANLSSSQLIKDAQEKYAQKAEREKAKLEQAQKEKILQREEKKKQALENKKEQALQDKKRQSKTKPAIEKKPVDLTDTKPISKRQSKTKMGIKKEPKPKKQVHVGEAKSDEQRSGVRTKQKEKTKIGNGAKSDLDKETKRNKILQENESDMEYLKKQAAQEKELKKKENQELMRKENENKDAISKKGKNEKDASSEKVKRTKKTGRDSSDLRNITIQKSLSKEINVLVKKTQPQQQTSPMKSFLGMTAADFQKLRAENLREKENEKRQNTIQTQSEKMTGRDSSDPLKLSMIKMQKSLIERINVFVKKTHPKRKSPGKELPPKRQTLNEKRSKLDGISLEMINDPPKQKTDIIIGENIFKRSPRTRLEKTKEQDGVPIFFHKDIVAGPDHRTEEEGQIIPDAAKPKKKKQGADVSRETIGVDPAKGIIRYALSDRTFIDKGWTMLPSEKIVRKMNVYRMRPAHPEFDWFNHNKNKGLMTYDTGERLAEFDDNGRGRWYYRNGRLALDYYDAEDKNAQQRFVVYSSGEHDERGRSHPITILATFDYLGNGIVFDHAGKTRLKYNQTEGVVLDRVIGPATHWQWHSLNDPPVLQQVMIDTQMSHKDPNILKLGQPDLKICRTENEDYMLAIEFDNFIREKNKKLSQKFKPFQIKCKALKINEYFSLKILDQSAIYLIYRDGTTNMKLNIGMLLDNREIVDTDTSELGEVSNSLERFPPRTDSLAYLQARVENTRRREKQRTNRERILRPQLPCASVDILTAAASPPMHLPLINVSTRSSPSTGQCTGHCSSKPTANLYYNARFLF